MSIEKILSFALILSLIFGGCKNPEVEYGPCKFAPPESKFPTVVSCEDCFFNLRFQDREYVFPGNKIASVVSGNYTNMTNVFLSFILRPPNTNEKLNSSIDLKTPLQTIDTITKLNYSSSSISTAFGIYNYCNDFFQPVTDDINRSYHRLTKAELIDSYPVMVNSEPHQRFSYYLAGEMRATFIINGEPRLVTADYRVQSVVYEKL